MSTLIENCFNTIFKLFFRWIVDTSGINILLNRERIVVVGVYDDGFQEKQ